MNINALRVLLFASIGYFALVPAASAHFNFKPPTPIPVDRLVENLKRQASRDPQRDQPFYSIGRIYSLAYAFGRSELDGYESDDRGGGPVVLDLYLETERLSVSTDSRMELAERLQCLSESIRYYELAAQNNMHPPLLLLALGWSYQEAAKYPDQIPYSSSNLGVRVREQRSAHRLLSALNSKDEARRKSTHRTLLAKASGLAPELQAALPHLDAKRAAEVKRVLACAWNDKALLVYREAYPALRSVSFRNKRFNRVLIEIAYGLKEILEAKQDPTIKEKRELKSVKADLETMNNFPRTVTPIVFSLHNSKPLDDLILPDVRVRFDLTGFGTCEEWPWVRPDTAVLVWDPARTGRITSGMQLIGSVTWWIFWNDGFEVLQALDDNADGWLSGIELNGLAVWLDSNTNGISEPGEVVPIESVGVRKIATSYSRRGDHYVANPTGLVMNDGCRLPLYDWSPESVSDTIPPHDDNRGRKHPLRPRGLRDLR